MTDEQLKKMAQGYSKWGKLSPEEQQRSIDEFNRASFGTRNIDSPFPGRWRTYQEIQELREEDAS